MDCSMPGLPVHHQLPEPTQTYDHRFSDAVQPFHPLSSPSPAFNLSQHQGLSNESVLCIRWPKYWSFSFSINPSNEYSGLISFRIEGFDHLAVQWLSRVFSSTIIQKCQFFGAQPSSSSSYICTWLLEKPQLWLYMDLSQQSDVSAFNMLCRFVIAFLPKSKFLLISWMQSMSAVILEPPKKASFTVSIISPFICHQVMGLDAIIFIFWILSFKPPSSLSSFTFIKKPFSSSLLSAIRALSSAYLRLLIFLPEILILACASFSLVFHMMYSACKLNKQGDNI